MRLEFALEFRFVLEARQEIPVAEDYVRGTVLMREGSFSGPGIKGRVLTGSGGNFPLLSADGSGHFDAQYLLETDDGVLIFKRSSGVRHAPPDVTRALAAHEPVAPARYYVRMTPRFEAPAGPYDWLNRTIFVGAGRRDPDQSVFRYWKVV
jgi:hypothetical protein